MLFSQNPFVYEPNPYLGSGLHEMVACFLDLGIAVHFTIDCVQLDETLQHESITARAMTDSDLFQKGRFEKLPAGEHDNSYSALPIVTAAYDKAKEIALSGYK